MNIKIEPLLKKHYVKVSKIFMEGIKTKNATFETEPPEWDHWNQNHLKNCRLVALIGDEVIGWAALIQISTRCVYSGVAELSVYIEEDFWGKGVGTTLLKEIILESEKLGIWTLQSAVFPENTASLKLHKKMGFVIVGRREKLGKMDDTWRDILLLERRSKTIGT